MIDFRIQPKGYEQGIYDIPFNEYRRIPALNSSKLKLLRKSPLHFKTAFELPPKPPTSIQQKAFDKGKLFDMAVLDNIEIDEMVAIAPRMNKNSKAYKEWLSMIPSNKMIMTRKDLNDVKGMVEAAFKKQRFSEIFNNGNPHRVVIWMDPETGIWCKAEIDWITNDGIIVDLKSTADASFWFFSRNAHRLGYVNQLAFYLQGVTAVTGIYHSDCLLAAVEKDPPYESMVYKPPFDIILNKIDENTDRMITVANCLATDEWPGYIDEIMCLETGQYEETLDEEMEDIDERF